MKLKNILAILLIACCTQLSFGQAAFLTSSGGFPWNSSDYTTCMDNVFGVGAWDNLDFETAAPNTLFSPAYTTIYLEGSDFTAGAFATFVLANQALMEAWVMAGGLLYINAAPNVNGNINIGFGGIVIEYDGINTFTDFGEIAPGIAGSCLITDDVDITAGFPIFGNFFGHAFVSGPGITPILLDQATGSTILAELPFGAGNVVIGGLTAPQFHDPLLEAKQLLENIITHVGCSRCGPTYTLTPSCQLGDEANFYVTIDVTDAGDDPSGYTVNGGAFADITAVGSYVIGPFPNGTATITFEGITTDCLIQGNVDFDCTCDPLAVDAGEDVSYCATQDPPVDLTATLGDIFPGGALGTYTVSTAAAGSCTATTDGAPTPVTLFDDDFTGPIPLPFSFNYFDNTYNDLYIGSNGYVTFGSGTTDLGNDPIPSTNTPSDIIALYWDDLNPSSGGVVSYFNSTVNGQSCFVVDFTDVPHFGGGAIVTGQIILCADGSITINCIDCQSDGGDATQGIENIDGTLGYFDPALIDGIDFGVGTQNCVTFTPDVDAPSGCTFVAWVTDLSDIAGTTVGTTETVSVAPATTTTYYAIVDCGSGLQCVDEVVVTDDPMLCLPPPTIMISDPCACGNPNNIGADPSDAMELVDYFVEEVTIDVPSAATNVMIVETANTGVVDASGATVSTSFINTGDTDGDGFDEWVATFYHVPDVGYTLSVDVDVEGTVTSLTESGTCAQCMLPLDDVPTVGEWGLMILGLLMLITAIVGIRQRNAIEVKA